MIIIELKPKMTAIWPSSLEKSRPARCPHSIANAAENFDNVFLRKFKFMPSQKTQSRSEIRLNRQDFALYGAILGAVG
jgi:hypothetical protein